MKLAVVLRPGGPMKGSRTVRVLSIVSIVATCMSCRPLVRSIPLAADSDVHITSPGVHYCLPRRSLRVRITRAPEAAPKGAPPGVSGPTADQVVLEEMPAEPDPTYCLTAQLDHSWFANDSITLSATKSHLLSGVNLTAEDKTGEIITVLAKTVVSIAGVLAAPPAPLVGLFAEKLIPAPPCTPPKAGEFTFVFDPSGEYLHNPTGADPGKLAETVLNSDIERACLPYRVVIHVPAAGVRRPPPLARPYAGLVSRRPRPYRVQLLWNPAGGAQAPLLDATATLPNGGELLLTKIDGSMLVRTSYSAKFDNGTLMEVKATKPSEALAWASLPLSLLGVLSAPAGDFFKISIDYSSKHEDVVEAQRVVIDGMQAASKAEPPHKPVDGAKAPVEKTP
jgi:hypothetical protein